MSHSSEKCDIFNILEIDNMCEYVSQHCIQNNFLNIYQLYFCDNFGKNVTTSVLYSYILKAIQIIIKNLFYYPNKSDFFYKNKPNFMKNIK
jgi:hypothetical protein